MGSVPPRATPPSEQIDWGGQVASCNKCGDLIVFLRTQRGSWVAVNNCEKARRAKEKGETYRRGEFHSHWDTCRGIKRNQPRL